LPDRILVGRVGRPHGIGGAFVVENPSDDPDRFAVGAMLFAAGEEAVVEESKRSGGRRVIRLDRPAARGAALEVERSSLPEPAEDHYYIADLLGLGVEREDGKALGNVAAVQDAPANAVLELDTGVLLPLVDACVLEVDVAARRIVVAPGFDSDD
jgi:16S rRNA processing protein RimM